MTLLSGLKSLITGRKEDVNADLSGTQAAGLAEAVEPRADSGKPRLPVVDMIDDGRSGGVDRVAVDGLRARIDALARDVEERVADPLEAEAAELKRAVESLRQRVESQSDGLATLLERLEHGAAGQPAPDVPSAERIAAEVSDRLAGQVAGQVEIIKGQSERVLELVGRQREQDEQRAATLDKAIDGAVERVASAAKADATALESLREKLESQGRMLRESMEQSASTPEHIRAIADRLIGLEKALSATSRGIESREQTLMQLLQRNKRSLTLFAYGCTLASLLALAIALAALLT